MALTVGELVAYIRADGSQFDAQVDRSGSKFEGLGRTVRAGTQAIARSFAAITTAGVALGVAVVKIGADYNRLQQSSRAALTTLLGSAEAANAQMDRLDDFARTSPFAKQVFITAQQQLLGFGVTAERVVPTLDAIQNAVAAVGGSNEQVASVTYALAQMQGQGKLTGETLNQLGQYGIDAATVLGEKFGLTGAQIREMASKPGGIPVDQVWDPLVEGLMGRFGGATANIKLQMDGAVDRIKGAWRDIGSVLAAPFIDPQGGGRAVEWANKVADALRALEQKAKPLVDLLVHRFKPGLDALVPALDKVRGGINAWDLSKINGQLDRLTKYTPLIAGTSAALFAMGTTGLPILSTFGINGINPVVAGIAALVATSPELRALGSDFLTALAPLLPILGRLVVGLSDVALEAAHRLTPGLRELLLAGADLAVTLGGATVSAVLALAQALLPVVSVAGDLLSVVADLPAPVLAGVAAMIAFRNVNLTPIVSSLSAAFGTMRETVSASRAVLEATGKQAGVMNTTMLTARVGVTGLGTALKTAFMSNPVGLAITGLTTALTVFATASAEAKARADSFAEAVKLVGEEADRAVTEVVKMNLVTGDNADWGGWQKWVTGAESAADAIEGLGYNLDEVAAKVAASDEEYTAFIGSLRETHAAMVATNEGTSRQRDTLIEMIVKLEQQREGLGRASHEQGQLGTTTATTTREIRTQAEVMQTLIDRQREAADRTLSLREAQLRAEESQIRLNEKVAEAIALNEDAEATEEQKAAAMRAVELAQIDVTNQYWNVIAAMERSNASAAELDATIRQQREAFIEATVAAGANRLEAIALAESYGLIPNRVETELIAEAAEAQRAIERFIETNTDRVIKMRVEANGTVTFNYGGPMSAVHDGALMEFYAGGGLRPGVGRLTPMRAIAQMVPPNTWRVVGDRSDVPEAYIPLNGSQRSLEILDRAAAHFGKITLPAGALSLQAAGSVTGRQQPLYQGAALTQQVTIHGVPADQPEKFAGELLFALRSLSRGSVYSREP